MPLNQRQLALIGAVFSILLSMPAIAKEECTETAFKSFEKWRVDAGETLNASSGECEKLGEEKCITETIAYQGMRLPIAAAIIIEGDNYGRRADAMLNQISKDAQKCTGAREDAENVYDFAREKLGITTILPPRATRIDFEEIRKGNPLGGPNSIIRKSGQSIDKLINPFKW